MWVQVEDKLKISFFVRKTYLLLNFLTLVSRCNIPVATTTCKTIQKVVLIVRCVCDDLHELEPPMATPPNTTKLCPSTKKSLKTRFWETGVGMTWVSVEHKKVLSQNTYWDKILRHAQEPFLLKDGIELKQFLDRHNTQQYLWGC